MAITVTLDRMIHAQAIHHGVGKEIGLQGDCASAGSDPDVNPLDLLAMSTAGCLIIVMAKSAKTRGIDLTGTWADVDCQLKDYVIQSIRVTVHSRYRPSEEDRAFLETESHHCPVYLAVKDGANVRVTFEWGSSAKPASSACAGSAQPNTKPASSACASSATA